ncbi:MAG: MFS transporter [Paracoccaceae bacterium]|jgi:MFS family permease|nr:MFS transporter [Paracoccaceae bacterium]
MPDRLPAMLPFLRANAAFLAAGALLTFTSSWGQTFFISVFAGEIREEFGLSHGAWGAIYAAGTFASAVAMIWAGQATDILRVRALSLIVLPVFAAACLAMAGATAAWMLVPVVFLLRLCGQGMTSHIATVAMARWFVATRGRALSVASVGFALGEATLPVAFVAAMALVDWRWLWVLVAVLILATLPVLGRLLALERTPQAEAEENQAHGMDGRHWRRAEVLRHWLFWAMVPFLLGPAAFSTAFFFHQVHFAETKALSHLGLVALFPVFTGAAVASMLLSGFLIDRFGTARLMPLAQAPMVVAFLVLSGAAGAWGVALGMILMALTVGANHTLPSAFWAEFYGTRHIGAVKAMAAAVMVFGTAVGPILTGTLIDAGLSLDEQMIGIAGWFLLACACTGLAISRAAALLPARA